MRKTDVLWPDRLCHIHWWKGSNGIPYTHSHSIAWNKLDTLTVSCMTACIPQNLVLGYLLYFKQYCTSRQVFLYELHLTWTGITVHYSSICHVNLLQHACLNWNWGSGDCKSSPNCFCIKSRKSQTQIRKIETITVLQLLQVNTGKYRWIQFKCLIHWCMYIPCVLRIKIVLHSRQKYRQVKIKETMKQP